MIDKRTVFVLGAGASCPYGYPSGARLRELICYNVGSSKGGFLQSYLDYLNRSNLDKAAKDTKRKEINQFIETYKNAGKSVDIFMANNPKFAPIGKYIIAFEIFRAEQESCFGEDLKRKKELFEDALQDRSRKQYLRGFSGFHGDDWYSDLHDRITKGLVGREALPDFSNGNISFITFNYDRSLEYFLYNSLRCLYSEVPEERIIQLLRQLKILHIYGQIAPLKWQNPNDCIDYKPQVDESLLERTAKNIRTIYEEEKNPELDKAKDLLKKAQQIFFLGFGYAPENMKILGLPSTIYLNCFVCGTGYGLIKEEAIRIEKAIEQARTQTSKERITIIESGLDCLMLLRKYLE